VRWSLLLLFLLLPAMAGTLKVLEAERLELREEGGEEVYVLVGSPVRLERDGEALEAERVVYFRGKRLLLLSGKVRYKDKEGRLIEAEELQVDLSDESFDALEVRIEAKDLLLTGPLCQRGRRGPSSSRGATPPPAPPAARRCPITPSGPGRSSSTPGTGWWPGGWSSWSRKSPSWSFPSSSSSSRRGSPGWRWARTTRGST